MNNDTKGDLQFSAYNHIEFAVLGIDDDDEVNELDVQGKHHLKFCDDPREFAKRLREAADFLDENGDECIVVDID